jgi:hypothetical protein
MEFPPDSCRPPHESESASASETSLYSSRIFEMKYERLPPSESPGIAAALVKSHSRYIGQENAAARPPPLGRFPGSGRSSHSAWSRPVSGRSRDGSPPCSGHVPGGSRTIPNHRDRFRCSGTRSRRCRPIPPIIPQLNHTTLPRALKVIPFAASDTRTQTSRWTPSSFGRSRNRKGNRPYHDGDVPASCAGSRLESPPASGDPVRRD